MARTFTGDNDVVNASSVAQPTLLSCYAWVKSPTLGSSARIMTNDDFVFSFNGSSLLAFDRQWASTQGTWTASPGTVTGWHHWGCVYDGGSTANNAVLWKDGVAQSTTRATAPVGSLVTVAGALGIGNRSGGTGFAKLNGTCGFVGLHNVLLNAGEMNEAMVYGWTPRGLVGLWPLLGDATEPDYSTAKHNGTVTGTTIVGGPPVQAALIPNIKMAAMV